MTASFLYVAASAGLLSLLTPCVFPMVPLTISFFSAEGRGRGHAVRAAAAFAAGIVLTFTTLGIVVAGVFGASGVTRLAANPWLNAGIAVGLLVFAASLLGYLELGAPTAVVNRFANGRRTPQATVVAAFGMGTLFALTSFSCTAPFVGTLLVTSASGGDLTLPVAGMLVYSASFAVPFVCLALVPTALRHAPRSGAWLGSLKVILGLIEIAAAIKFAANADAIWHGGVLTRVSVLVAWAALAVTGGVYLCGGLRFPQDVARVRPTRARALGSTALLATAIYLALGARGLRVGELEAFMPPALGVVHDGAGAQRWHVNALDSALSVARAEQRPVFVDFTGYTCTNCRWMEANMFARAEVSRELSRFVLARLFTDGEGAVYERQQAYQREAFHTVALPLYAVLAPDGRVIATSPGITRDPERFMEFLRSGLRGMRRTLASGE